MLPSPLPVTGDQCVFCKYESSSSSYLAAHDTGHGLPSRVMFGKHTTDNINSVFRTEGSKILSPLGSIKLCWRELAGLAVTFLRCSGLTSSHLHHRHRAPGTRLCLHRDTPPPPGTPLVGRGSRVVREERSDIEFRRRNNVRVNG